MILEFGVSKGGSLQMWRSYFGRRAMIYGVDVDPRCARFGGRRVKVFIGDQEDREFLRSIAAEIGPIDVLIEDGGHTMGQQIATFEELYPHLRPDGVFLIEDVHTSYWKRYGGGYRRPGTFMEYAKGLTDQLNCGTPPRRVSLSTSSRAPPGRCTSTTASLCSRGGPW